MSNPNQNMRPSLPSMLSDNQGNKNNAPNNTPPTSSSSFNPQDAGSSKSPGQGIRLPPISFLSNISSMSNPHQMAPPSSLGVPRLLNNVDQPSASNPNTPNTVSTPQFGSTGTPGSDLNNKISPPTIPSIAHLTSQREQPSFNTTPTEIKSETPNQLPKPSFLSNIVSSNNTNEPRLPTPQQVPQVPQVKLKEDITKPDVNEESDEDIIKYYENKYGITDFTNEEKHDILQHEKRARIEKAKNPNYKTYLCYSIIKRLNTIQPTKKSQLEEETIVKLPAQKFVKREIIINNDDVLDFASKFPRKHLGSLLYTPYPTRSTHRQLSVFQPSEYNTPEPNEQETEIVPLLPELRDYINCILTVRIPSYQINDLQNNKNYINRAIWGTDVYTDDSDILLILKHNGFLPSIDNELENTINNGSNFTTEKTTPGNKAEPHNIDQTVNNFRHFINIIGGDIHVDLIILPTLNKYEGIYRNGVNSRDWKTGHDGVSVAIYGVRYGEINSAVENVNDVDVKKRKIDQVNEMRETPVEILDNDGKWKLNYEAWKKIKLQIELEKSKKSGKSDEKDGGEKPEEKK
ncbi:hypothetical protein WICANDRAFT_60700 [Wickerhamomyces anomalus NRRL Y-366-8]|uniref:Uncharacterized protein n=1 Tax=Wickerhamomyces anomalus (strain ATCC 58044 / CBS 1984 / NCYC 433 / NRRL Y-366-8) TaxID=683960 RepID=A0A1E3PBP9_WICAA|nr:uncharacterized protein WICANDRAFT_60700 [Wickerhamomyces anomalus NRRL Y-366-8]ODQ62644.1 hypothetical protein WICANDRAFT_60700 [Wickerhamomyces anomalus NRRL Y-366-8]